MPIGHSPKVGARRRHRTGCLPGKNRMLYQTELGAHGGSCGTRNRVVSVDSGVPYLSANDPHLVAMERLELSSAG